MYFKFHIQGFRAFWDVKVGISGKYRNSNVVNALYKMKTRKIGSNVYPNIDSEEYIALKEFCTKSNIGLMFTEDDCIEVSVGDEYNLLDSPADLVVQDSKTLGTVLMVWIGLSEVVFTDSEDKELCKFSIV